MGFPSGADSKACMQGKRPGFDPWVRKIPWRRKWLPSPVFLPGESIDRGPFFSFNSVFQLCPNFATPWMQHDCPSPTPRVHSNSRPQSWWCHPTFTSSVVPFSSCPQYIPASGSFQISQFFASGGQSIGASASASVLSMNIQDWSPLGWTSWISLLSKGLSRVFSNNTVQKHQFFGNQLSL